MFHMVLLSNVDFEQIIASTVGNIFPLSVLQVRAGQWSITANLWPLTTHIYHVMIIVTGGFSKKSYYYYYYFYFVEIHLNDLELVFLELLNIRKSFLFRA